jgi:hypothetical protein
LHPHTLTFRQLTQPAPTERRGMDEYILATAILPYEAKPPVAIVHLNRTDAFRGRPDTGLQLRRGTMGRAPRRCAGHLSRTRVDLSLQGLPPECKTRRGVNRRAAF